MYSDVEVVESVDEDFINALALLRSSEHDSAERLKRMLDSTIEKKLAFVPVKKTTKLKLTSNDYSRKIIDHFEEQIRLENNDFQCRISSIKRDECNSAVVVKEMIDISTRIPRQIFTINLDDDDDSVDNTDIPRISIPDETTDDYVICKICKGDKLGPLILLECQECQDAYHPLCHQPAVVEIDIYDPRLVWRCGKCIEMSNENPTLSDNVNFHVTRRLDKNEPDNSENIVKDVSSKMATDSTRKKLHDNETSKLLRCYGRTRSRWNENLDNSLRRSSRFMQKNSSSLLLNSSVHLRKRVGSRLSVTRLSPSK